MINLNKIKEIHFVGIGGIGMSGLAFMALDLGIKVTGSDEKENKQIQELSKMGAHISIGHNKDNIKDQDLVVLSSAIKKDNPEVILANEKKINCLKRAEFLNLLMQNKKQILVAGSHGKTTTTSFLAHSFNELHLNPSYFVGGILNASNKNFQLGNGNYFISEADESDGSFLSYNPSLAIITNIDTDHLDYYKNYEALVDSFSHFAKKVLKNNGKIIMSAQDKNMDKFKSFLEGNLVTFGFANNSVCEDVDYLIFDVINNEGDCEFKIKHKQDVTNINIKLFGEHNILNATAAFALLNELGFLKTDISRALQSFTGVGRRLEKIQNKYFDVIDDYAHHPTEINEILKTIRLYKRKFKVLFEPHRFTRTKEFFNEFVDVLKNDELFILPIYSASEAFDESMSSEKLCEEINKLSGHATFLNSYEELYKFFTPGYLHLIMGAGPISVKTRKYLENYEP